MYFRKSTTSIVCIPSYYKKILERSKLLEVRPERKILIFPSSKQNLIISSHPNNLKSSTRIADPLAPYSLSGKIIAEYLEKSGLNRYSYLVHLGYINDGGILVIDPITMKSVNENFKPYLNFSGLDYKRFEKVMEKRKWKRDWYLKQGFSEEDIEKIKIIEDMETEKRAVRKNRSVIRKNLISFFKPFYEEYGEDFKVFVLDSSNSFEYKAVRSSLKKLNALNCLKHKNLEPGENYSSLENLKSLMTYLLYQLGFKKGVKTGKHFAEIEMDFNWPPEFDFESNSYTVFEKEFLEGYRSSVFGRVVSDRVRYWKFLEEYKNFLRKFGLSEEEIGKRIEVLPSYEPIENLILKQHERIGELKPFEGEIKKFDGEKNILNSFSASQFSAPCTLTRVYQALEVRIFEMEEEEKIFLGDKYHGLVLSDPENDAYINHEIWKLAGLKPIPRSQYTEKDIGQEIEFDGRKINLSGRVDAISRCDGEIVLFEYKLSQVLPEIYKISHAKQLLAYKKILESLGYEVADVGILLYGIAPPTRPELKSSVTNRYVIFSSSLEEIFLEDLEDYFYWIYEIYHEPESIRKLREIEVERGCKVCCRDKHAELKEEEVIKKMKEIRQRLHS